MKKLLIAAAVLAAFCTSMQAQPGQGRPFGGRPMPKTSIVLPELLQGEPVLQQCTDARIWGKAVPGSEVTVNTPWNDCN